MNSSAILRSDSALRAAAQLIVDKYSSTPAFDRIDRVVAPLLVAHSHRVEECSKLLGQRWLQLALVRKLHPNTDQTRTLMCYLVTRGVPMKDVIVEIKSIDRRLALSLCKALAGE